MNNSVTLSLCLCVLVLSFCDVKCSIDHPFLISSRLPKLNFTNETIEALRRFAPLEDLHLQNICHVVPFGVIDDVVSSVLLDQNHCLKPGNAVDTNRLMDLRMDIFKVDNDAAYLHQADMRSKVAFFRENAKQRTKFDETVAKLKGMKNNKTYEETIRKIMSLLYNAPANLRVSPTSCLNNATTFYEDPNLQTYDGISYQNLLKSKFTKQSKTVAKKYKLDLLHDKNGFIQTTDRKKVLLNPTLKQSLVKINKGLNVFQLQ